MRINPGNGFNLKDLGLDLEVVMEKERDKGYAWVVLGAALVNNTLWAGLYTSASIYILDWIDVYEGGTMALGMVGGTLNGLNFFSGLFVGPLVDRFDCRIVSFSGTLLTVIGLLASSQTTSTLGLYLCFGIISGFGCGWTVVPAILVVQYYFDKHRPFAAGFSMMGQGLGTFILMPVLQLLIQYYGWRGAMIIHAGIMLQILIVASLFRPFDLSQIYSDQHQTLKDTKKDNVNYPDKTDKPQSDKKSKKTCYRKCTTFCRNTWDLSLLKIPVYIQYTVALVVIQYPAILFYRFISLKAHADNISKMESSLLPSIAGLVSTLSRILFSFIANCKCSHRLMMCGAGALGQGIVVMVTCMALDFYSYACCAALFGFFTGMHFTLTTTVMADLMGVVRLAQANSFLSLFTSLAILTALPIAGAMIDSTGSFNLPFMAYGLIGCISAILIFLVPITRKYTDNPYDYPKTQEEPTKKLTQTNALKIYMSTESIHSIT